MAPLAARGDPAASNVRNQTSPLESRTVNPGAKPDVFGRITVHEPLAGPLVVFGPAVSSAIDTGRAYTRLMNQLESGTSSIVLTSRARTPVAGSPGCANRLRSASLTRSMSRGF